MSFGSARIKLPPTARAGETVTVRALVGHSMESGFRKGPDGRVVPRLIVHSFTASFDGEILLAGDFEPAMAANPYVEFAFTATRTGTLRCVWVEDGGAEIAAEASIEVSAG